MEIAIVAKILGAVVYAGLEYWLGKTEKTKAASVVELLLDGVKYVVGKGVSPDGK